MNLLRCDIYMQVFYNTNRELEQINSVLFLSLFSKYNGLRGSKLIICQGSAPFLLRSLELKTMSH